VNLTIECAHAQAVLSTLAGIAGRKSTIDILSNVLLIAEGETLRIVATDMELEAHAAIPAKIVTEGRTTVAADRLADIAKNVPSGADLTLYTPDDDPRLFIKSGRSTFRLPQLDAGDFPMLPGDEGEGFTVTAGDLRNLLDDSMIMGDADDPRPFVQSVYLHVAGSALRCIGASQHGLSYRDIDLPDEAVGYQGEMIGLNHAAKLRGLLNGVSETAPVRIDTGEGRLSFTFGAFRLVCVAINGGYIDYQRPIAMAKVSHEFTADVDLLTGAMRRALIMQTEKVKSVRLTCEAGVLTLSARNMRMGESDDAIDVDASGDFAITVKGPQFLDVLARIRTESVVVKLDANGKAPLTINETGEPPTFYLVMPMAL
jgi:DNA polymerase-3 subunit beta